MRNIDPIRVSAFRGYHIRNDDGNSETTSGQGFRGFEVGNPRGAIAPSQNRNGMNPKN
ncbi:MAG TPA: hypothetical protein V6D12_24470 [Candidatus Obscuribacterales bacterium]